VPLDIPIVADNPSHAARYQGLLGKIPQKAAADILLKGINVVQDVDSEARKNFAQKYKLPRGKIEGFYVREDQSLYVGPDTTDEVFYHEIGHSVQAKSATPEWRDAWKAEWSFSDQFNTPTESFAEAFSSWMREQPLPPRTKKAMESWYRD